MDAGALAWRGRRNMESGSADPAHTMPVIDLRSDTLSLPTPEMLQSIVTARLGDDSRDGDPTVLELEAEAARMLGKEAAILTVSDRCRTPWRCAPTPSRARRRSSRKRRISMGWSTAPSPRRAGCS